MSINFATRGGSDMAAFKLAILASDAVDANSDKPYLMRAGLLMAKRYSDSKIVPYDPTQADGVQYPFGFLTDPVYNVDSTGSPVDRSVRLQVKGFIKTAWLYGLDPHTLAILGRRFLFRQDYSRTAFNNFQPFGLAIKATSYTLIPGDSGIMFVNTSDCDYTLPTIEDGLALRLYIGAAVTGTKIISAEGNNIIANGGAGVASATADSVSWLEADGAVRGTNFLIEAIDIGSSTLRWLVTPFNSFAVPVLDA